MRKRIVRISPLQLGKVAAVFYAIISIPFVVILALMGSLFPSTSGMSMGMLIAIPLMYLIMGFIFMAIAALLYNLVAKWTGGVEFDSEEQLAS